MFIWGDRMSNAGLSMKAGAAIFLALAALAGGVAVARGPNTLLPIAGSGPGLDSWHYDSASARSDPEDAPRRVQKHRVASLASRNIVGSVCVRLCDGSFFPASAAAGGDAACSEQCPDAPVALYSMPTDRIDDAISLKGARYTELPVAKRHETAYDSTCTCHRDRSVSHVAELLRDPTLRKGDLVMTTDGFKVFEGAYAGAAHPSDFVALAHATNVTRDQRAALVAMEHSTAGRPDRLRGTVTVDDGAIHAER